MKLEGNTILITGGGSGIGLGLATRLMVDNRVIICGRDKSKLERAVKDNPRLEYLVADLQDAGERNALAWTLIERYPALNVLINNAGIQRRNDGTVAEDWQETASEIAINLEAPIHLTRLLTPHLEKQANAAVLNVTSGLAFSPMALMPVYCATKAAMHSYTLSLRHTLAKKKIEVIEIIPPAVQTDLGGKGLHTFGVPLTDFCDAMIEGLRMGIPEIAYGTALTRSRASRAELDEYFAQINK